MTSAPDGLRGRSSWWRWLLPSPPGSCRAAANAPPAPGAPRRPEVHLLPDEQRLARRHLQAAGERPQRGLAGVLGGDSAGRLSTPTSAARTASRTPSSPAPTRRSRCVSTTPDESDRVRYPLGATPRIEAGSDAHALVVDRSTCKLYETYATANTPAGWTAGSGAVFDLRSNALRPDGWTSADAAGLPILPGLLRYDEVAVGQRRPRDPLHRLAYRRRATSGRRGTTRERQRATCRRWGPASG